MIRFTVIGKPEPQGSARAFYIKKLGRAVITSDNAKLKPWRQQVSGMAMEAMKGYQVQAAGTAIRVEARFYFDRPKSIKRTALKTTKPDADKLLRAILDALTGIVFNDDAQVTECFVTKSFGQPARVEIAVSLASEAA